MGDGGPQSLLPQHTCREAMGSRVPLHASARLDPSQHAIAPKAFSFATFPMTHVQSLPLQIRQFQTNQSMLSLSQGLQVPEPGVPQKADVTHEEGSGCCGEPGT